MKTLIRISFSILIALLVGFQLKTISRSRTHSIANPQTQTESGDSPIVSSQAKSIENQDGKTQLKEESTEKNSLSKPEVKAEDTPPHAENTDSPYRPKGTNIPLHERLFPHSKVISEEQTAPNDQGVVTRIQLLQTGFKYPLVRLEERWKGDKELPPIAMVANHVMVEKKETMSDTEFKKAIEAQGISIDRMIPDSSIFIVSFNAKDAHTIENVLDQLRQPDTAILQAAPDYIRFAGR